MQKLTAYYLILLYACSLAKPVVIWFADVMAHSYFAHQHLSVVHHYEGGKEHVHYQIDKAAKDDAPEQKTATTKNNEDITVASFVGTLPHLAGSINTNHYAPRLIVLPTISLSVQIPPPWVPASFFCA